MTSALRCECCPSVPGSNPAASHCSVRKIPSSRTTPLTARRSVVGQSSQEWGHRRSSRGEEERKLKEEDAGKRRRTRELTFSMSSVLPWRGRSNQLSLTSPLSTPSAVGVTYNRRRTIITRAGSGAFDGHTPVRTKTTGHLQEVTQRFGR